MFRTKQSAGSAPSGARTCSILLAVGLTLATACATHRSAELSTEEEFGWPEENPRVLLESVIPLDHREGRGGKLLRWLTEEPIAEAFLRPYAVAWDGDDLLVTDPDSGLAARIDRRGKVHTTSRGLFDQPIGVAACEQGIVVSDSRIGGIALLDRDLRLIGWLAQNLSRPTGITCDGGRIFLAETGAHRIVVLDPDGARRTIGERGNEPGQFNYPTSLAYDEGILFVADTMNFRVQRIEAETGRFLDAFGEIGDAPGAMPRLKGIALDRAGHLWVADGYLDRVSLFDAAGALLISIGGTGNEVTEFSFPAGIAAHVDGRVAVVDSLNRRLKVFRVIESSPPGGA